MHSYKLLAIGVVIGLAAAGVASTLAASAASAMAASFAAAQAERRELADTGASRAKYEPRASSVRYQTEGTAPSR